MEGIETNDDPNDAPNDAINDPTNDDLAVDQSESTKTGSGEVLHSAATPHPMIEAGTAFISVFVFVFTIRIGYINRGTWENLSELLSMYLSKESLIH